MLRFIGNSSAEFSGRKSCSPKNPENLQAFIGKARKFIQKGGIFLLLYSTLLHLPPQDSTVSEDAGIAPRTAATSALAVRRSNRSARSHQNLSLHIPSYRQSHNFLLKGTQD